MLAWIDTHVHWDASEFDVDRPEALVRARQAGVVACFNPSVSVSGIDAVHALAEASAQNPEWPRILPAYGIHPLFVEGSVDADLEALDRQILARRPQAIGEIGLDGYTGAPGMDQQRPWFEAQLALAIKHELPVLLHLRHAVEEVILSVKRVQGSLHKIPGGFAHAFNGSESQAKQLMALGFMIGFGGSLTYEGSTRIRRLAAQLPLTHIVLETDSPDMSPVWLNRARNEPAELPKIAQTLAALRGITVDQLSEQTCANARRWMPDAG